MDDEPKKKFGISTSVDMYEYLQSRRHTIDDGTGETIIRNRSDVACDLLRIGRAANEIIENSPELDLDPGRPRESFVRQAVLNELNREDLDDGR